MDASTWLWVALIAFLAFCCGSMLFMGRRRDTSKSIDQSRAKDPPDQG